MKSPTNGSEKNRIERKEVIDTRQEEETDKGKDSLVNGEVMAQKAGGGADTECVAGRIEV